MKKSVRKSKLDKLIYKLKLMRKYSWMTFAVIAFVVVGIGVSGTYLPWYFMSPKPVGTLSELPQTGSGSTVKVQSIFNLTVTQSNCNLATKSYVVVQELRRINDNSLIQSMVEEVGVDYGKKQQVASQFKEVNSVSVGTGLNVVYLVRAKDADGNLSSLLDSSTQKVTLSSATVEGVRTISCFAGEF